MSNWVCFLCLPFPRSGLLQRRQKWRGWLKAFCDRESVRGSEGAGRERAGGWGVLGEAGDWASRTDGEARGSDCHISLLPAALRAGDETGLKQVPLPHFPPGVWWTGFFQAGSELSRRGGLGLGRGAPRVRQVGANPEAARIGRDGAQRGTDRSWTQGMDAGPLEGGGQEP